LDDCEFHAIVDCPLNQTCRDTETAWANARLIAAAPELLAALIELDHHMMTEMPLGTYPNGTFEVVRAAIAKATGEA